VSLSTISWIQVPGKQQASKSGWQRNAPISCSGHSPVNITLLFFFISAEAQPPPLPHVTEVITLSCSPGSSSGNNFFRDHLGTGAG